MNKQELIAQLRLQYGEFTGYIGQLNEAEYLFAPPGKWHAGQQLQHLVKAVWPVRLAFGLPRFIPALLFGKSNRPSRSYETLVARYKSKLAAGGRAGALFIPPPSSFSKRTALCVRLQQHVDKLIQHVEQLDENQLDTYILPHPLLGKLTLREMLYFTIYHAEHHLSSIRNYARPTDSKQS